MDREAHHVSHTERKSSGLQRVPQQQVCRCARREVLLHARLAENAKGVRGPTLVQLDTDKLVGPPRALFPPDVPQDFIIPKSYTLIDESV